MWLFAAKTIETEVKRRKISLLLHSTHLYRNLPQLLQDKSLDTARSLIQRYGRERALQFLHDPKRYEKFAVGLDYINCSLSVPNYELLYHRSKASWQQEWIHLALDCSLLCKEETKFSPLSAAQEQGKHIRSGLAGFQAMFADQVEDCTRAGLDKHLPTHPQAEALVKGPLSLNAIEKILVSDMGVAKEIERLLDMHSLTIKVQVTPQLFVWPERLMKG
jgi:hypothetical protein